MKEQQTGFPKDLIAYLSTLQQLTPIQQVLISELCTIVELPANALLQNIGKTCKTIYFVQKGIARIFYYKEGVDITEYFAFKNDLIIRAESLFSGSPSQKGIETLKETSFIAIPAEHLFALFDKHLNIERLYRKLIEKSYTETLQRVAQFQLYSPEERYLQLLKKSPHLVQHIPLKHIASFLGITQVSLSRIRARLR